MELPQRRPDDLQDEGDVSFRLAEIRPALCGYVASLLPHPAAMEDVVQETCLFLWESRETYVPGTNFKAWAFKTAYFKALSHRRDLQRDKVITLSEDLIHRIADAAESHADSTDVRLDALRRCVASLNDKDRQLLLSKYHERRSLTDQANAAGIPANRLQKALSRIRLALRHCIAKTQNPSP